MAAAPSMTYSAYRAAIVLFSSEIRLNTVSGSGIDAYTRFPTTSREPSDHTNASTVTTATTRIAGRRRHKSTAPDTSTISSGTPRYSPFSLAPENVSANRADEAVLKYMAESGMTGPSRSPRYSDVFCTGPGTCAGPAASSHTG